LPSLVRVGLELISVAIPGLTTIISTISEPVSAAAVTKAVTGESPVPLTLNAAL